MQTIFYTLIGWIHILFYVYYRRQIPEIDKDLSRRTYGKTGVKAFTNVLGLKDYRNVFYYRVPLIPRNIMNIILPRVPDCKIQCPLDKCGGGIFVHHGWGTIVLAESIGENLDVYQNIAANSVVRHDIPDGSLVYGNPCVIKNAKEVL